MQDEVPDQKALLFAYLTHNTQFFGLLRYVLFHKAIAFAIFSQASELLLITRLSSRDTIDESLHRFRKQLASRNLSNSFSLFLHRGPLPQREV
jgi:hypothetical protein